jgi:chemotaxis protein histidine kinase CheA
MIHSTYRVSPNKAQYKRGFEEFLLSAGLYACWIGDVTTANTCVSVKIDGTDKSTNVRGRIWGTVCGLREGDRLIMAGRTGFYIGNIIGDAKAELVDDNTPLGLSARAAVHCHATKSHKRHLASVAEIARARGVDNEVVEVTIPVAWSRLDKPTEEQLEWATATQGSITNRAIPFPEPPATAILTPVMTAARKAELEAAAARAAEEAVRSEKAAKEAEKEAAKAAAREVKAEERQAKIAAKAAHKAWLAYEKDKAKEAKAAAKAAEKAAAAEIKAKNRADMKALRAAYKQAQRTGTEFIPDATLV